MMILQTHCYNQPGDTLHRANFIRKAYTPHDFPFEFPEQEYEVLVRCKEGQSVQDVIDYHYFGKYRELIILGEIDENYSGKSGAVI